MNSRLEQFVRDHREEFDAEEPGNKIWEKISADMSPSSRSGKGSLPGDKKKTGCAGPVQPGTVERRGRRRPPDGGSRLVF